MLINDCFLNSFQSLPFRLMYWSKSSDGYTANDYNVKWVSYHFDYQQHSHQYLSFHPLLNSFWLSLNNFAVTPCRQFVSVKLSLGLHFMSSNLKPQHLPYQARCYILKQRMQHFSLLNPLSQFRHLKFFLHRHIHIPPFQYSISLLFCICFIFSLQKKAGFWVYQLCACIHMICLPNTCL